MTQSAVKVKVCGLTQIENALACAQAGAHSIGLNFHPASPRSISVERGIELSRTLKKQHPDVARVGVFVNLPFNKLAEIIAEASLSHVQLHGDEPPDYLADCRSSPSPVQVIRAFRLSDNLSVDRMLAYLDRVETLGCPPDAILVDAHVPGLPGGTGQTIAMELLEQLPPHPCLILAGGLNPENVAEYVARVRPWMVDVASGVESSPGMKDPAKVAAFVAAARRA